MDKIFIDEAVNELHTIQDMLRWAVSRFSAANIWYGHGTDNPWDEALQLVLPSLYLAAGYSGGYALRASDFAKNTASLSA